MAFFKDALTDLNGIAKDLGKIGMLVVIIGFFLYIFYNLFLKDRMQE